MWVLCVFLTYQEKKKSAKKIDKKIDLSFTDSNPRCVGQKRSSALRLHYALNRDGLSCSVVQTFGYLDKKVDCSSANRRCNTLSIDPHYATLRGASLSAQSLQPALLHNHVAWLPSRDGVCTQRIRFVTSSSEDVTKRVNLGGKCHHWIPGVS